MSSRAEVSFKCPEHKVYVKANQSTILAPSLVSTRVLPFASSGNFAIKSSSKDSSSEILGRCIRTTTIAGNFEGGNNAVFKKSLSRDNKTLCSSQATEYNLEFLMPFEVYPTSTPLFERDLTNLESTSSSAKNLSFNVDKSFTSQSFSSVMQSSLDMLFSQGWICFKDFFNRSSRFEHFKNYINHNPGSLESWLSMTNLIVCNNVLVNFDSHKAGEGKCIFKSIGEKADLTSLLTFSSQETAITV